MPSHYDYLQANEEARKRLLAAQVHTQPIPQGVSRRRPEGGFTSKPQTAQPAPAGPNLTPTGVPASPKMVGALNQVLGGQAGPTNIFSNRPKLMDAPGDSGFTPDQPNQGQVDRSNLHPSRELGMSGYRSASELIESLPGFNSIANAPLAGARVAADLAQRTPLYKAGVKAVDAGQRLAQGASNTVSGIQDTARYFPGELVDRAGELVDRGRGAAGGVKDFLRRVGDTPQGQQIKSVIAMLPPMVAARVLESGHDAMLILMNPNLTGEQMGKALMDGFSATLEREGAIAREPFKLPVEVIKGAAGALPEPVKDLIKKFPSAAKDAAGSMVEDVKGLFGKEGGDIDAMGVTPQVGPLQGPRQERFIERAARLGRGRDAAGLALHEKNLKNMTRVDPRTGERVRKRSAARGVSRRTGPMTRKELAYNQEQQKFAAGEAAIRRSDAAAAAYAKRAGGGGSAPDLSAHAAQAGTANKNLSPEFLGFMDQDPDSERLFKEVTEFSTGGKKKSKWLLDWQKRSGHEIPEPY